MSSKNVLIVEDIASLQVIYRTVLRREGFDVRVASTAAEAAEAFADDPPDIVLLDLLLPDRDGIAFMQELDWSPEACRVIVITAHGSINRAVAAMRAGAFDFLVKPFDDTRLVAAVRNAQADLRCQAGTVRARAVNELGLDGFVGTSPAMREVYDKIARVAPSVSPVFVTGETGTGKAMCAQAIHALSNRSDRPFLTVCCATPETAALEAELFGTAASPGALERANGGTLYLSDITEMDLRVQTLLLRFLQGSAMPDHSGKVPTAPLDVRLVCGAVEPMSAAVDTGQFREDLFYRLHVVPIDLPPLRARGDDAIAIAQDTLLRLAREERKVFAGLGRDVKRVFSGHTWPGNVRQLLNVISTAVLLHDGETLELQMLPAEFLRTIAQEATLRNGTPAPEVVALPESAPASVGQAVELLAASDMPLADLERTLIEAVIARNNGSVPQAARQLQLSPSTLYRKRESWKDVAEG